MAVTPFTELAPNFAAICAAVAFAGVLLGRETFFFRDFGYFGLPLAHFHREAF